MVKQIYKILRKYPLSIIILTAIIYLSFFKPSTNPFSAVKNFDKIAHFVMYAGFCSVLWFEYFLTHTKVNTRKVFLWIIVAPFIFGGLIEFAQSCLTNHRGGEFADFMYNSLGVICATLFSVCVIKPLMEKYNLQGKRIV